ncbi:hypothetical protein B0H67DRAFT_474030 [Lasiosphaeris hirsuta]|uniref:Uncharacterized protein n=1 Tax=Lasiosphaeris hirsuta TaxID=260670 RepID=A0AA40BE58_9PEZI|nr:hypothetical protein B0H67DRAFT_474030 [Lasiosphaeris hirsuta]
MATVNASFEFLQWQDSYEQEKPYEVFLPLSSFQNKIPRSNLVFETRLVHVQDAYGQRESFELDTHSFQFVRHPTDLRDLKDRDVVNGEYVAEVEAFLRRHLDDGSKANEASIVCFDLRLRESVDADEFSKRVVNLEDGFDPLPPSTHPHVDQSMHGAALRVRRHMGDRAEEVLKGRIRIINVWRPLSRVRSWPLAVCDSCTVKPEDLVACDIIRRRYVGETYFGKYNQDQKWYYLSDMDEDDVLLLKIYDSKPGVATPCLHASLPLSSGPGDQAQRESIELRFLVFTES